MREPESVSAPGATDYSHSDTALARELVRFTRRASRRYNLARSSVADLLADLYVNGLVLLCVGMVAASFVLTLREQFADRRGQASSVINEQWQILPIQTLWFLVTVLALLTITSAARKLGPIAVGRSEAAWWLPLPVDRRPMIMAPFLLRSLGAGATGAAVFVPFSVLTSLGVPLDTHVVAALTFGAGVVLATAGAGLLQQGSSSDRWMRAGLAAGLTACAALPFVLPSPWALTVALVLAGMVLVLASRSAPVVPGSELVRGGAVSDHVAASVFFMDTNELRRALHTAPGPAAAARASRFYARPARGPIRALVRAEVVAFLRLSSAPIAPLMWLAIVIAVLLADPALPVPAQVAVLVLAGCVTSAGTGTVARRLAVVPAVDALLPVALPVTKCVRLLMPGLGLACWTGALALVLGLLGTAGPLLVVLGLVAGLGMGAGAVRGAIRPATDWTTPPVETPFGPVPRDQISSLLRGTDATLLAMVPLIVAVFFGTVTVPLLGAQILATGVSVLLAVAPSARTRR